MTSTTGTRHALTTVVLVGWAAKGVVYVALSWLVLQLALGEPDEAASTDGALQLVAGTGPGRVALVLLGTGLLAYAAGRVLEVTVLAEPQVGTRDRVQAAVLALAYGLLALTALGTVAAGGGGSASSRSAELMALPAGRLLVGLAGLLVVLAGAYQARQGVRQAFLGTLRTGEMSPTLRLLATRLGTAAYVTRGAVLVLLGGFLVQAAVTFDPDRARGLDAALREVAGQPGGRAALVVVALGVLAYGLFALLEARWRRVGSSATGTT